MNFKEYAQSRGYKIYNTPGDLLAEFKEITEQFSAIEEMVYEQHGDLPDDKKWKICDIHLKESRNWFMLGILGFYFSAKFVDTQLRPFLKMPEVESLPVKSQLCGIAVDLLLWLELTKSDRSQFGGEAFIERPKEQVGAFYSNAFKGK